MSYYPDSGFTALGSGLPQRTAPRDWIVWHFTHCANLPSIVDSEHLYPSTRRQPVVNVALRDVKTRRHRIEVKPDEQYPLNKSVAEHVPFYIAPKSPMLYAVTHGHTDYTGGADPLSSWDYRSVVSLTEVSYGAQVTQMQPPTSSGSPGRLNVSEASSISISSVRRCGVRQPKTNIDRVDAPPRCSYLIRYRWR
jgi:hypothetical protein